MSVLTKHAMLSRENHQRLFGDCDSKCEKSQDEQGIVCYCRPGALLHYTAATLTPGCRFGTDQLTTVQRPNINDSFHLSDK